MAAVSNERLICWTHMHGWEWTMPSSRYTVLLTWRLKTRNARATRGNCLAKDIDSICCALFELNNLQFRMLKPKCESRKIGFSATLLDIESARFLTKELGCRIVKVGSRDLDVFPLLTCLSVAGVDIESALSAIAYERMLDANGRKPFFKRGYPSGAEAAHTRREFGESCGSISLCFIARTNTRPTAIPRTQALSPH
jgi:hypothetical protein